MKRKEPYILTELSTLALEPVKLSDETGMQVENGYYIFQNLIPFRQQFFSVYLMML